MIKIPGGYRLYCKGASEIVLHLCTLALSPEGSQVPLEEDEKTVIETTIQTLATEGLRTIALGYRDFPLTPEGNLLLFLSLLLTWQLS